MSETIEEAFEALEDEMRDLVDGQGVITGAQDAARAVALAVFEEAKMAPPMVAPEWWARLQARIEALGQ